PLANSQHQPRVMGGEIASACYLVNVPLKIAGLPGHLCAHRIGIGHFAFELDAQPMIELADVIAEQEGSSVVENHQHIHAAIVIKVSDRQATRGKLLVEDRPTLVAHVLKSSPVA